MAVLFEDLADATEGQALDIQFVGVAATSHQTTARASTHARSPATLVMVELPHASWKSRSLTFSLPNSRLAKLGVSREIKRRVIRDLERGGLIIVERRPSKSPIVTMVWR